MGPLDRGGCLAHADAPTEKAGARAAWGGCLSAGPAGVERAVTSLAHGFSEFSLPGCFQQTLTERLMPQALC